MDATLFKAVEGPFDKRIRYHQNVLLSFKNKKWPFTNKSRKDFEDELRMLKEYKKLNESKQ